MKALLIVPIAVSTLLIGCSTDDLLLQRRTDYRNNGNQVSKSTLELPPDLSAPATNTAFKLPVKAALNASAIATGADAEAKLVTAGGQRWLVIKGSPEKVWDEVRDFWINQGFILARENMPSGVMETDWLENRAKLPQDKLTQILSKISSRFASTGELDMYRTRLEQGAEPNTTEVFISHRGKIEAYRDNGSTETRFSTAVTDTIWIPRPSEPELEAEMLALFLQHIGMQAAPARAIVASPQPITKTELIGKSLHMSDTYDRAWRRAGLAIERTGFIVTDRDRSQGTYYVRRADAELKETEEPGFFSKLAFWRDNEAEKKAKEIEYKVILKAEGEKTVLSVSPKDTTNAEMEQQLIDGLLKQLK